MRKNILILLYIFLVAQVFAQNGCDGQRYLEFVFSQVDTTKAVQFGSNTTIGGANKDLFMDIYEPVGDTLSHRPVIIWAFGGSFISGDRNQLSDLCHRFARMGYVAVAIDYRTYDGPFFPLPDSLAFLNVATQAISDMKASIRKLREDADNGNLYRIDSDKIIGGGVSAGAITALHTAVVDSTDNIPQYILNAIQANGGWEGNSSSNTQYSSELAAVVNYSGALCRANFIDANDPPIFSVHDDGDNIVPYGSGFGAFDLGFMQINIIYLEGSSLVNQRASDEGVTHDLITRVGSNGHVSYLASNPWQDSVINATAAFLEEKVICSPMLTTAHIATPQTTAFPNPSVGDIMLSLSELPSDYSIILYDAMGREVYRQMNINHQNVIIPRGQVPAGLYHISIRFDDPKLPLVEQRVVFR